MHCTPNSDSTLSTPSRSSPTATSRRACRRKSADVGFTYGASVVSATGDLCGGHYAAGPTDMDLRVGDVTGLASAARTVHDIQLDRTSQSPTSDSITT